MLWDDDARLARPLLEALYAEGDLIVGENEPYAGQLEGDCLWQHGDQRGLASAIVEVRQDLIRDAGRPGGLGQAHVPRRCDSGAWAMPAHHRIGAAADDVEPRKPEAAASAAPARRKDGDGP